MATFSTGTAAFLIASLASSYAATPRFVFSFADIAPVDTSMIEKPEYALAKPCSVRSSPSSSSSSLTLSPKIALMIANTISIPTAAQAATAANPTNWIPS